MSRPLVGAAAAVFPATGAPGEAATLEETGAFIAAYEEARGAPWDDDQRQVTGAAGLWARAFNAKKAALRADGGPVLRHLKIEAVDRLRLAGAYKGERCYVDNALAGSDSLPGPSFLGEST
ncbi:MAG TPA: hypothetical protein VG184_10385 [Acidimicrobiales bacterium]|nr:hypothetical protein [Acidimicrobiales bacterium]